MENKKQSTGKRLTVELIVVIVLVVCLATTSAALAYATVTVDNNIFQTGTVELNLNDGKPVIEENEFLFEPGMTVKKDFFVENRSTWDVYYRLYLADVEGGLADYIEITILDGDRVLYNGLASELTKETVQAADDLLKLNETRYLSIWFHYLPKAGNKSMDMSLSFTLCADAVQTKNNPNKLFD